MANLVQCGPVELGASESALGFVLLRPKAQTSPAYQRRIRRRRNREAWSVRQKVNRAGPYVGEVRVYEPAEPFALQLQQRARVRNTIGSISVPYRACEPKAQGVLRVCAQGVLRVLALRHRRGGRLAHQESPRSESRVQSRSFGTQSPPPFSLGAALVSVVSISSLSRFLRMAPCLARCL